MNPWHLDACITWQKRIDLMRYDQGLHHAVGVRTHGQRGHWGAFQCVSISQSSHNFYHDTSCSLHSRKPTWTLNMMVWKRSFLSTMVFFLVSMLACGSVVAIGHDNDLRISDHIVTAIGRDVCPKCTKLMRWTNIRIYPHLHNLHITVDIVCPQLRKLNYNIPVWNWLINGWAWLSCNLLLSTSTVYCHDLSTFNTWRQAPGRLILPRVTCGIHDENVMVVIHGAQQMWKNSSIQKHLKHLVYLLSSTVIAGWMLATVIMMYTPNLSYRKLSGLHLPQGQPDWNFSSGAALQPTDHQTGSGTPFFMNLARF